MRAAVLVACAACSFHHGSGPAGAAAGDASQLDGVVFTDGPPPDWWNPAWMYRIQLTVHATTAVATGFQVGFAYDLDAAPCTGSRDGARIVWQQAELARVVDEVGPPTWIWFRLGAPIAAGAASSEYWLYCGNASPPPAPADPATVFDLYDDFAGSSLAPQWSAAGTVTVGGGVATIQNNGTFHSTATFAPNTATDFSIAPQGTAPGMYYWGGFQNGTATASPWVLWNTRNENGIHPEVVDSQGSTATGGLVAYDTAFRLYGVENYGASSMYRIADASVATLAHPHGIAAALSVRFDNYNSGASTVQVGMVRVRAAVDPPPTVTAGAVETYTR
ncbi:MAG: DUF2341 domain-containing protein [Acidobacteriota bacterium]